MPLTHASIDLGLKLGLEFSAKPVGLPKISNVAQIPDSPPSFDHTNGWDGFEILGNGPDKTLTVNGGKPAGDCGFVMTVNAACVDALETAEPFTMPTSNAVVLDYFRYNHGADRGVQNPQLFNYWHTVGLPWGGKLHSWADANHYDFDESMAACNAFGCLALEIVVWQEMMEASNAGEPWDWTPATDDTPEGGHDTLCIARVNGDGGELITWGLRQPFTLAWWKHAVQGASVLLTEAQIARNGNGYGIEVDRLESFMSGMAA